MSKHRYLHKPANWRGHAMLFTACLIWGCQFPVSKLVLSAIEPMELVFLRLVIGAACLFVIGLLSHVSWRIRKHDWPLIITISLLEYAFSIWAQFYGTQLATSQLAVIIMTSTPVFMIIFARLILKEWITFSKWIAVFVATAGVAVIIGVGNISTSQLTGAFFLILAMTSLALAMVLVKKVPGDYSMISITMYCMLISDIILAPMEIGQFPAAWAAMAGNWQIMAGVLFIGFIATGLAYYFLNKGLTYTSASTGSMYFFVQPVAGVLLGWLLLGETIGLSFIIGTAMILGSAIIVAKGGH